MKSAVLEAPKQLKIKEMDKPKPGFGEVLIRVKAAAVCGTDLSIYLGKPPINYPMVLGHESSGVVEELGEGVMEFAVGDRVVNNPLIYCNMCPKCYKGDFHVCENGGLLGRDANGIFAEFMVLPKERLFKIPESISWIEGTSVNLLATCLWGLAKISITPTDSVAILGQGVSGLVWNQLVALSGASPLLGISRSQWKLDLGEKYGAKTINAKKLDPVEEVLRATQGKGASVVIESAGVPQTMAQTMEMVATGGTILVFGILPSQVEHFNFSQLYYKEVKIVGTRAMRPLDFLEAIKLIDEKRIDISKLATHTFPLSKADEAFRTAADGKDSLRVVVEM